jgi:hypothetical protein
MGDNVSKTQFELEQEELPAVVKGCIMIPGMIGILVFLIYIALFYPGIVRLW